MLIQAGSGAARTCKAWHLHALRMVGRRPEQSLTHLPIDWAKSNIDFAMSSNS